MEQKKSFNLRLEPELIAEMKIQAIKENRTVTEMITTLLKEYLRKKQKK